VRIAVFLPFYNRVVKSVFPAFGMVLFSALLGTVGCRNSAIDTDDAVKQGVMKYLSKRSDLAAMDVSLSSVKFRGNEADANVHFQAKNNSSPGAAMNLTYLLERKGDEWVVKGRAGGGAGANPHSGAVQQEMPGGSSLPPGHPAVAPAGRPQTMPELPQLPAKK
jgi:hypothetical protein